MLDALVKLVRQHFFGDACCAAEFVQFRDPVPPTQECLHLVVSFVFDGLVHLVGEHLIGPVVFGGVVLVY